jgi:hypothetical protein
MSWKGAVKVAVNLNFGAVKVSGGAVILAQSSREGLAGPGNPGINQLLQYPRVLRLLK